MGPCRRQAFSGTPAESLETADERWSQVADGPGHGDRDRVGRRERSVATRPSASRVRPRPAGTWSPVCHLSTRPISPGRYDVP
jgi:hypothetical protein